MLKTTVKYNDFLGNERAKTLYFNISRAELTRIMINESDYVKESADDDLVAREYLSTRIEGVMERGRGSEMIELFDWLLRNSYGEISDDGETFEKSDEIFERWTKSANYEEFYYNLLTNADEASDFVKSVLPADLMENLAEKAEEDPEFKRHREELEKRKSQ